MSITSSPYASVTFYGPDGCGKSALAQNLAEQFPEADPVVIGGGNYREWLTDDIARRFTGTELDDKVPPVLYEDIAVACYGYAQELVDQDRMAIVDSDPYLKRFIWAIKELGQGEQFEEYACSFEERMTRRIGEVCAPQHLVVVHLDEPAGTLSREKMAEITQSRIEGRSVVTDYDPTTVEENLIIHDAARYVLTNFIAARRFPRITASQQHIVNSQCHTPEEVTEQTAALAFEVAERLRAR